MQRDNQEIFRHMAEWNAFKRRHNANIFDVLFKDVDYSLKEDDLLEIVQHVAQFFHLELPDVYTQCDSLAKMHLSPEEGKNSELYFNWKLLKEHGINNREAFTLCMVHEMAHLYFKGKRFMLCRNERWCHELAADYVVGLYVTLFQLPSGKYKYVVGTLKGSLTHPDGKHRADIVEYARHFCEQRRASDLRTLLVGLPSFIYLRSAQLNRELEECLALAKEESSTAVKPSTDWRNLPDNNLLKQEILKRLKKK